MKKSDMTSSHIKFNWIILGKEGKMKKLIFIILMLSCWQFVFGQAYVTNTGFGTEVKGNSAELIGIGGSNYAVKMMEMLNFNPAAFCFEGDYAVNAGLRLQALDEVRRIPAYDGFDAVYNLSAYAGNTHYFPKFYGFAGADLKSLVNFPVRFGLGYAPAVDFDYMYERTYSYPDAGNASEEFIMGEAVIDIDGDINAVSAGLNADIMGYFNLGLTFQSLSGDYSYKTIYDEREEASGEMDTVYHSFSDVSLSGSRVIFGLYKRIMERYDIGFSYRTSYTLDGDGEVFVYGAGTNNLKTEITYPSKIGFSFGYYPKNEILNYFTISVDYQDYKETGEIKRNEESDFVIEPTENVVGFSFGLEHIFRHLIPLRLGYRYENSYNDDTIITNTFSVGTAIELTDDLVMDLAGNFGKTNYEAYNLFKDIIPISEGDWPGKDKIEETSFQLNVSFKYTF